MVPLNSVVSSCVEIEQYCGKNIKQNNTVVNLETVCPESSGVARES